VASIEIIVPNKEEVLRWWRLLLREEELVDRSILVVERWRTEPTLIIPCGKYRRAGSVVVSDEAMDEVLRKLRMRPHGFPDVRFAKEDSSGGDVIVWGDDLTDLWKQRETGSPANIAVEAHRNLGRAFGYKEERIMSIYTDDFYNPESPEYLKGVVDDDD